MISASLAPEGGYTIGVTTRLLAMPNEDLDFRFLSTLSHDLRGGLHSVQLALDMLRGDVLESTSMEQLLSDVELARKSLVETGARAERIICARRIQRGMMPVRLSIVDVAAAVQTAVRTTAFSEEDSAARVHVELAERTEVASDARLVGELVGGLLDYVLRSVPGGIIRLRLDSGGLLDFSVDRTWITPSVAAMFAVVTNDPPFGDAMLGLYVAGGVSRLLGTSLQTLSDRTLQVSFAGRSDQVAN